MPELPQAALRFFSLDTTDPRLASLRNIAPQVHLLFCWTCHVAQEFFYELRADGSIRIIRYGEGDEGEDFPYEHYPRYFPAGYAELTPLTAEQQAIITGLNEGEIEPYGDRDIMDLDVPAHQLGGEPFVIQPWEDFELACPRCGREMPFLASVGDECLSVKGFVDNAYTQVGYSICPDCHIIGAVNRCD